MSRVEHSFQFEANEIAAAAGKEAGYHRAREAYWRDEFNAAVAIVADTIGARVERQAITGGYAVDVVIDRGDPAAYARMQRSFLKAQRHGRIALIELSLFGVYGSQFDRSYELSRADVQYFRLSAPPRSVGDNLEDEE